MDGVPVDPSPVRAVRVDEHVRVAVVFNARVGTRDTACEELNIGMRAAPDGRRVFLHAIAPGDLGALCDDHASAGRRLLIYAKLPGALFGKFVPFKGRACEVIRSDTREILGRRLPISASLTYFSHGARHREKERPIGRANTPMGGRPRSSWSTDIVAEKESIGAKLILTLLYFGPFVG